MEGMFYSRLTLLYLIFILCSNPLGCAVAMTALSVLVEERLAERSLKLGEYFRSAIRKLNSPLVAEVRGRGLLNAVVIDEAKSLKGRTAWQFCLLLKSRGVLAKPTHVNMFVSLLFSVWSF
jgi:ornithine--oxo-acid transaminase